MNGGSDADGSDGFFQESVSSVKNCKSTDIGSNISLQMASSFLSYLNENLQKQVTFSP